MKLKDTIKQRILDHGSLSLELALKLGFTQTWVKELARTNKINGPLTTAAALEVIKKDMGCLEDSEVLDKVNDSIAA